VKASSQCRAATQEMEDRDLVESRSVHESYPLAADEEAYNPGFRADRVVEASVEA
jgi:hypothetical protein